MNLKQELIVALPGIDKDGNTVERNKDIVSVLSLNDDGDNDSIESKKCVESFCEKLKPYQGYVAINEDYEAFYIPPYDDIASQIRHKIKGKNFIIVDLSKIDKMAYKIAERH